jgi:diacylglycerol O-acyltransferase
MLEGLEEGRWALLAKVHHCLVDGIAGIGLLTAILDSRPEVAWPAPVAWHPNTPPSRLRLVAGAGIDVVASRYRQRRAVWAALQRPGCALRLFHDTAVRLTRPDPHWLTGPIGRYRRWSSTSVPLDDVQRVRARLGGTVNDIALAAITCGFRELLATGDQAWVWAPRALVPVSMRRTRDGGLSGNHLSAAFVRLPVNVDDPVERLARIRGERDHAKQSGQALAAHTLTTLAGLAPPPLLALCARLATRLVARFGSGVASTVTTNIHGPDNLLYACGRRLEAISPFAPIASPLRIGVAIFSYNGRLTFGVTADRDTVPDVAAMCSGIEIGIAELLNLVGSPLPPRVGGWL